MICRTCGCTLSVVAANNYWVLARASGDTYICSINVQRHLAIHRTHRSVQRRLHSHEMSARRLVIVTGAVSQPVSLLHTLSVH
jgi:hypothetical protein